MLTLDVRMCEFTTQDPNDHSKHFVLV